MSARKTKRTAKRLTPKTLPKDDSELLALMVDAATSRGMKATSSTLFRSATGYPCEITGTSDGPPAFCCAMGALGLVLGAKSNIEVAVLCDRAGLGFLAYGNDRRVKDPDNEAPTFIDPGLTYDSGTFDENRAISLGIAFIDAMERF